MTTRHKTGTFLLLCLLGIGLAAAGENQRASFKKALAQIGAGKARVTDYTQLKGYVLYPYLEAEQLRRDLRSNPGPRTDQRIRDFLSEHGQEAATQLLRSAWLAMMAERGNWADVLTYQPATPDEKTRCQAALGKIRLKRSDALEAASALWLTGKLRDKACVPVFDWLAASGNLSQALIEGRVALAREAEQTKVVSYLIQKLQAGQARRQAELWLRGYGDPHGFIRAYINGSYRDADQTTLKQIFMRSARRSPDTGAQLHAAFVAKAGFNAQAAGELAAWVGYRKILNRHPDALAWYQRAGDTELDALQRKWRLRSAVRVQDWRAIRDFTENLSDEEVGDNRWHYWRARALEALGDPTAKALYKRIAAERSFYGFMAADRIGQPYTIVDHPLTADKRIQAGLGQRGELQRARELYAVGMRPEAREEFKQFMDGAEPTELQQAALMALDWGWHSQAALAMGKSRYWDEMATRFPVVYREAVQAAAKRENIPAGWIYGIMRSESLFVPDARSYANAYGLMQLLPGTGKLVAREIGWRWRGIAGLKQPDYNIRLGSHYLRMMLDKFDQHIAMATASYNAGPGNAIRWLDEDRRLPADVWIETVPFNATHAYLLHVLEYTAVYNWRLTGKPLSLKELLPPVPARDDVD